MFVVTRPLVRVVARDAAQKRACEHLLGVLALDSALWAVGRVARQEVLEAAERNMRCGCQHLPRELRALQALLAGYILMSGYRFTVYRGIWAETLILVGIE